MNLSSKSSELVVLCCCHCMYLSSHRANPLRYDASRVQEVVERVPLELLSYHCEYWVAPEFEVSIRGTAYHYTCCSHTLSL